MVESDSLLAIKEINKQQDLFCEWGGLILDIEDLSLNFQSYSFKHIKRAANICAHNAAKLPCEIDSLIVWRNY